MKSTMEMFEMYTFEAPVKKPARCPHLSARGSSLGYFTSGVHYYAYDIFSIVARSFLLDIPDKNGPCSSPMYLLVCARDKLAAESVVMEIKLQMNNVFIMCESSPLSLMSSTV